MREGNLGIWGKGGFGVAYIASVIIDQLDKNIVVIRPFG